MINTLITFIHLLIMLPIYFFVFYTKNNKYDYFYLILLYFILLQWTILNNECIVSYVYKKINNNDYVAGSEFINDDLYIIYGEYRNYIHIFDILLIYNIYMVFKRNNIKNNIIFIYIYIYLFYKLCFYYCINNKLIYKIIIIKIQIIMFLFALYIYTNQDNIYNTDCLIR
jgi:hypothetical protein